MVEIEEKKLKSDFNTLFNNNIDLIFQNRELVLSKKEYYLLSPIQLTSGGAYIGGFSYKLGELFDSFESGGHFYYEEFGGFKKMYLVSTQGSPLSGTHTFVFWSEKERRIIKRDECHGSLPRPWAESYGRFMKILKRVKVLDEEPEINVQLKSLKSLLFP